MHCPKIRIIRFSLLYLLYPAYFCGCVPRVGVSIIALYYPLLSSIALAERACVVVSR